MARNVGCVTGGLVILFVLFVAGLIVYEVSAPNQESPPMIELHGLALGKGTALLIMNDDAFDWNDVQIDLNPTTHFMNYKAYSGSTNRIEAGKSKTFDLRTFTLEDGTRFNPYQTAPMGLYIQCNTPKGRGHTSLPILPAK